MNDQNQKAWYQDLRWRRSAEGEASWRLNILSFLAPFLVIFLLFVWAETLGMAGLGVLLLGIFIFPVAGIIVAFAMWISSPSRRTKSAAFSFLLGWIVMLAFAIFGVKFMPPEPDEPQQEHPRQQALNL